MATHNELGKTGEEAAVEYLQTNGYTILHRNWRRGHLELDIVAMKDEELVVVEVKTRASDVFGHPIAAVTPQKIRRTVRAADAYIRLFHITAEVRFDVIAVIGSSGNLRVEHYPCAFYPPLM
jgi:putative endonuclease